MPRKKSGLYSKSKLLVKADQDLKLFESQDTGISNPDKKFTEIFATGVWLWMS
jgi:hypothetical protein